MHKTNLPLGLGTAALGRPQYINIRQENTEAFSLPVFRQKGWDLLEAAYAQGVRYFDTAPGYGLAEELLIDWVNHKQDDTLMIATKWGYTYVANFDPKATIHEVKEHSLAKLKEQWEQSKRLLPNFKVYQIHSATFETGVLANEAILNHLAFLKKEHHLSIGLTTTGDNQVDVIKKALSIEVDNIPLFDVFQVTYNIFDQSLSSISNLIDADKKLVIKEALANGRVFPSDRYPHYLTAYKRLEQLAKKYQVGIDAIALRFCLDSLNVFKVLSGASNPQHLVDNLKAVQFQLEARDIAWLKELAISPQAYWVERKRLGWN